MRLSVLSVLCTAVSAHLANMGQAAGAGANPTATIGIGQIVGTQTAVPGATAAANKFLGVPFAVSPPQRFSRPVAAAKLNSPLQAQSWRPACFQQFSFPFLSGDFIGSVYNVPVPAESEDCLYLNVYAPASGAAGKSVLFWIPAGEMTFGNAGQPSYDGSAFAAFHDVIVVVANFRSNVFGLPSSPQLTGSAGNLALLDQRLALQWVQDNIQAFGGDPTKVTIGGVSSGGWNAEIMQYTYPANNLPFRAVIQNSGQSEYLPFPITPSSAGWNTLASTFGCLADQVNCLRLPPGAAIKVDVENLGLGFQLNLDNVTLPSSPYSVVKSNNYAHVPVLAGSSSQEARFYVYNQNNQSATIQSLFGSNPVMKGNIPAILAAYPVGGVYKNDYEALSAVVTDLLFTCPISLYTSDLHRQGSPVWQSYYNASFPNIAFSDDSGAYHASDVRIMFQTYNGGPLYPTTFGPSGSIRTQLAPTQQEKDLSTFMNNAYANFIKNPTQGPGWDPVFANGSPQVGVFGNTSSGSGSGSGVTLESRTPITNNCHLFFPAYTQASPGVPNLTDANLN